MEPLELSVLHLFHREEYRERTALITRTERFTYRDVVAQIERVAAGLWAQGVRKGDRVAIHLTNCPQFMPLLYGVWQLGAVAAFIDIYNPVPRLVDWCNFAGATLLIVDETRIEAVAPYLKDLTTCRTTITTAAAISEQVAAAAPGVLPWGALLEHDTPAPTEPLSGDDCLVLIQTSGTTARPKGIWHTLDSFNARLRSHLQCPPLLPEDVVCPMSPLSTVAGLNATSLPALAMGASVMLFANAWDASSVLEQVAEGGGTIIMAGPARIHGLIQAAKARPELTRNQLRFVLTGGDTVSEALRSSWDETFTGIPLLEGYGLSETLGGVIINMLGEHNHAGNVGRPFPGVEIKLVGPEGLHAPSVPDGTAGELWCKSDFLFRGYWNDPERTRESLVDGWFKTGDLAVRSPDGTYRILGRTDFLIMRGTLNISPVELESVIQRHPTVGDCLVSGFPNETLGQDVEAFLVLRQPLPLKELQGYLLEHLGAAFCPSRFWQVPEIPKTSMGKVDRRAAEQLRGRATLMAE